MVKQPIRRRRFLLGASLAGPMLLALREPRSARGYAVNERLNIALVGLGNRGTDFLDAIPAAGENLVALCEVNRERLNRALNRAAQARAFQDFRKMLDELDRQIDALVVATPDHTHALIAARVMKRGKHVYVEKPIAHDVFEARTLRQLAARYGLATQMGNQGMASDSFRRTLELVQDGAIGEIREAHVWFVGEGSGPLRRPKGTVPVPEQFDWDLWLGPAPFRPYHPRYVAEWWAWREFGTGWLGGGGSHSMNMTFKALNLRALWNAGDGPDKKIAIETEVSERSPENFPRWQIVRFSIPARGDMPPACIHWYNAPEAELRRQGIWQRLEQIAGRPLEWKDGSWTPRSGSLLVGSKGVVHTNAHNSSCKLLPEADFPDAGGPPRRLPRAGDHLKEWAKACKGGPKPFSDFDHSGPVIELLLLGNVASLVLQPFRFDPVRGQIIDNKAADQALRPPARQGWEL